MRWYRHGDPLASAFDISASLGRRYVSRMDPSHPIAPPCGRVWMHRAVLYDEIGEGIHACHWCHVPLEWRPTTDDTKPLTVDHLNRDGF